MPTSATGRARTRHRGKGHYFPGPSGTSNPASAYARFLTGLASADAGGSLGIPPSASTLTISELVLRDSEYAESGREDDPPGRVPALHRRGRRADPADLPLDAPAWRPGLDPDAGGRQANVRARGIALRGSFIAPMAASSRNPS